MKWILLSLVFGGCPSSFFGDDEQDADAGVPIDERCRHEDQVGNTYTTEDGVLCTCTACAPGECTDFYWNCVQPGVEECLVPEDLGNQMTTADGHDCTCIECAEYECPTGTEVRWDCV